VKQRLTYIAQVVALATIYVVTARAGLRLDAVSGFATLVWAPTGIGLAALWISRGRLWPGLFIGAAVANLLTGAPLPVALGIGIGNTLESVLGAYALRRIPGFRSTLDRLPDVLGLIVLAATISTMVSATIGVSSLFLGGLVAVEGVAPTWRAWWLGDLIGDILVAPALPVWATGVLRPLNLRRALEGAALGVYVLLVSLLLFRSAPTETPAFGEAYMFFPLLIWAVLRFGQRGGVTATVVISLVAVWGTALGHGPFVRPDLQRGLLALQTFMGITATTFLVLGASVSERRRAMADLEAANAEQKRLHDAAAAANRAKSEFMAVMSHELRTPLNAIAGYVDLLQLGIRGPLTADQQHDLKRIQWSEGSLRRLIEDVLGFAKLEAGAVRYRFADVLLDAVLADLEPLVAPQLRAKGLAYRCMLPGDGLTAWTDGERVAQILRNLASNAIKFTTIGSVEVHCNAGVHDVRIAVTDTGSGIPAESREMIFEPFMQADRALTRTAEGTGLGLSISRQLARAMGGDLAVESEVGVGSTFTLVLPRTRQDAAQDRAPVQV
jgi:signal transduction histidine kinase